jgi:hypothetical protein
MGAGSKALKWPWRAAAIAAAVVAVAGLAGGAGATGRYTDAGGDSGAAPDITGATVNSTASGQILFHVGIAGLPQSGDVETVVAVDADANPDTGWTNGDGAEFVFVVDQSDHTYGFARWTGSDWDWYTPYTTVTVTTASDGVTISVNRSELGATSELNFWTRTLTADGGDGKSDDAPDDGVWNYDLAAGGPKIVGATITTAPGAGPRAGKRFSIRVDGLTLPTARSATSVLPTPETTACKATLAGRALGGSGCSWKLPKSARGKTLRVVVTVTYEGTTASFPYSFKVRR